MQRFICITYIILCLGVILVALKAFDLCFISNPSNELFKFILFIFIFPFSIGSVHFLGGYLKWDALSNINSDCAKLMFCTIPFIRRYISSTMYRWFNITFGFLLLSLSLLFMTIPLIKLFRL